MSSHGWHRWMARRRRNEIAKERELKEFRTLGTPIKIKREPESYFHLPVTERIKTDRLLPKLKFLERPDP